MIVRVPEERFPTAPAGTFTAVCVDEIDQGLVENRFDPDKKPRHMVKLVWQIEECQADGTPYHIAKDYTASLHEKASLRKDLETWRGKQFTFDELVGFDLEKIIGVGCLISIVHNVGSKGGTFSNVGAVMALPKNMKPFSPKGYVRVKDRVAQPAPAPVSQPKPRPVPVEEQPPDMSEYDRYHGITDEDVPF